MIQKNKVFKGNIIGRDRASASASILKFIFSIIIFSPIITYGQFASQDSTVNLDRSIIPTMTSINSYREELSRIFFTSLDHSDSILKDQRLKYSIRSTLGNYSSARNLRRFITEYSRDSTGMTYYFPMNDVRSNNYFVYFRNFSDFISLRAPGDANFRRVKTPFITIHGNAYYEFLYRNRIDTPFTANHFHQHNEQTYVNATIKGKYPFRIMVNSRQTNSPFFKNYTNVDVQFNHQAYRQMLKDAMIADITRKVQLLNQETMFDESLNLHRKEYTALKNWIESPARTQEIVQEREQTYKKYQQFDKGELKEALSLIIPLVNDSLKNTPYGKNVKPFIDTLTENKKKKDSILALLQEPTETEKKLRREGMVIDSLYKEILTIQHKADSLKGSVASSIAEQTNRIRRETSIKELVAMGGKAGISSFGKTEKNLLAVTQFGIGRSSLNYSDLTVSNISFTGVNVEYNPSYYAAFAAGSVDYLFRDFVINPANTPRQKLVLGRLGWGDKEKEIFIITAYNGTKNNFGGNISDTLPFTPRVNAANIFGYSFEGRYRINQNADASIEVAKSSSPYNGVANRAKSFGQAFAFSDRNNEAWSARLNFSIPVTGSTINLLYKQIGADFQSYSIYNTGNRQEAWSIKWRQYLFKNSLSVTAQIKKNKFDDPFVPTNYNSAIILKSIQVVYRRKKWPVFSLGYTPTSQIIKSSDGHLSQSIYYALTSSLFYNYTFLKLRMNSNLMYSRFYNQGTDSGFILYNAKNLLYSHNIDLGKWHSQSIVEYTKQPGFAYWTFQQRIDVQIGKILTIGAGLKNNVVSVTNAVYWGANGQADLRLKQLGGFQMQYDKGYLPDGLKGLVSNNWGRVMWYKVF